MCFYCRKSIAEQQLQPASQLQSISHASSQSLSQSQQSLQQMSNLQQPTVNMKHDETINAGLLDDGVSIPGQDKIAAERERQRQREQERRRREAVSIFSNNQKYYFRDATRTFITYY